MKRLLSFVLSFALVFSFVPSAFAASNEANEAAQSLYELGLFNGTGTDANGNPIFDLDRAPTRHEAVTMLVRLLGKGEEAESGTWNTPFTDVADWAKPYVGYAYTNGLTAGTSATTYSGNSTVTASEYLTFVLRALGYSSGTDFQWDKAWELSDSLGITDGQYDADTTVFTRGDVAIISYRALNTTLKGTSIVLGDTLPQEQPNISGDKEEPSLTTEQEKNGDPTDFELLTLTNYMLDASGALRDVNDAIYEAKLKDIEGNATRACHRTLDAFYGLKRSLTFFDYAISWCGDYSSLGSTKVWLESGKEALDNCITTIESTSGTITEVNYDIILPRIENAKNVAVERLLKATEVLP